MTPECPNCGHEDHSDKRCRGNTDEGQECVCSWPDPYNFATTVRTATKQESIVEPFVHVLAREYSKLNFEQFCEKIGEPLELHGRANDYAEEIWHAWREMAKSVSRLGTFLPKLLDE
jgi:hypothetical protein